MFSKKTKKNRKTIRVSNGLDQDQDRHFVGPDLGPNCLKSRQQKSPLALKQLKTCSTQRESSFLFGFLLYLLKMETRDKAGIIWNWNVDNINLLDNLIPILKIKFPKFQISIVMRKRIVCV